MKPKDVATDDGRRLCCGSEHWRDVGGHDNGKIGFAVKEDQRKPDVPVQLTNKMIPSEKVVIGHFENRRR
ncbi:hypothetical protein [Tateyamaria pelophila]|uniref:hypothetical protein n=1 Tax=Tateyamaria pelophila TaxID=328415 RepID=UPI001CBE1C57|nr:hypothetical protein [Tateyamaria pelophila]